MSVTIVPVLTLRLYQLVCPTTTKPDAVVPTETDVWFPVPDTVTTLPDKPEYDTEQELVPANSALVDDCFDPDNVDTQQLFNNFIPEGDTEPVYDVSADIDSLIQPKNQLIPIRYRLRSVLVVLKADYSLKARLTDVFGAVKLSAQAQLYTYKVTLNTGQFLYQASAANLLKVFSSFAATAYNVRGNALVTVGGLKTVEVGVTPIDFGVSVGGLPKTIAVEAAKIGVVGLPTIIDADLIIKAPVVVVGVEVLTPTILVDDSLYLFNEFEFTNGTQTGRLGPSYANLIAAYDTNQYEWLLDTSFYDAQNGIQTWTVAQSGTYRITAYGASGGGTENRGGRGAIIEGEFNLTAGTKIDILVGQESSSSLRSGGGGGSFVVEQLSQNVLVVAGGGGGSRDRPNTPYEGMHASLTTSGKDATLIGGTGGSNGSGGGGSNEGAGGGGMFGDGGSGGSDRLGGSAYILGGNGGLSTVYASGGFGGGGSGWDSTGGGGGYSGGGGGAWQSPGPEGNQYNFGGGGGSFNSGANPSSAVRPDAGHGKVIIVLLSAVGKPL